VVFRSKRDRLAGLAAVVSLFSGTAVYVASTRETVREFCLGGEFQLGVNRESFVIDGVSYRLGHLLDKAAIESKCGGTFSPGIGLFPDCSVYRKLPDERFHTRMTPLKPFFDDGTCDGRDGGSLLPGAPNPPFPPTSTFGHTGELASNE
jgi:hypothetical protein